MLILDQVALKRFIDNVAVDLVETELVAKLCDIFCPISAYEMPPDMIERIARESEDNRRLREQLREQLDVLAQGSDFCRRFMGMRFGAT